jgi:hypothetical protein
MDEAEAGIGIGWMMEGVESSCGVYGRERAGSSAGVSGRGRDRDRDREGGGEIEGEVSETEGESYGCSSSARLCGLAAELEKEGCSGLRRKGAARIGTEGAGDTGTISGVRRLEALGLVWKRWGLNTLIR